MLPRLSLEASGLPFSQLQHAMDVCLHHPPSVHLYLRVCRTRLCGAVEIRASAEFSRCLACRPHGFARHTCVGRPRGQQPVEPHRLVHSYYWLGWCDLVFQREPQHSQARLSVGFTRACQDPAGPTTDPRGALGDLGARALHLVERTDHVLQAHPLRVDDVGFRDPGLVYHRG